MSNLLLAIQAIKQAKEQFEDFQRQYPATRGAKLCELYVNKLNWIGKDLITNPRFSDDIINGVKQEWESDSFAVPAIYEKVSLLDPNKRDMIETIVDGLLAGEEIVFTDNTTDNLNKNDSLMMDEFHQWIETNDWDLCPVKSEEGIKYRWVSEHSNHQWTTGELYDFFKESKFKI